MKARFFFLLLLFLLPVDLHAASSPNVPIDSPLYTSMDKLIAFGLVNSGIYAQRPWSRNEMARLTAVAMGNYEKKCGNNEASKACPLMDEIVRNMKREFWDELVNRGIIDQKKRPVSVHVIDSARLDFLFDNSGYRTVPVNDGLGTIDAKVNSFNRYREGAHAVRGANFLFESDHWAALTKFASIYVKPRWEMTVDLDRDFNAKAALQNGYAKLNFGNFELLAGRDSLIWGNSAEGGVLASSNARPLDMIKISNDSPFQLPWIFKYLGYNKYTFFVADLGPEYVYKDALMYGFAASLKPASFIEFGFEHQFTFGGNGAPNYDLLDLFSEFFLHRRTGGIAGGPNVGDHRIGWNLRLQIPPLKNSVIYAEGVLEDKRFRAFWHQFTQQMAFQSGLYVPLLTPNGKNSLRLQYEHIPAAYGRHGQWISGLTLNGLSRGSPYGSQSQSLTAEWEHQFSDNRRLDLSGTYVNNGNDQFTNVDFADGGAGEVIKTADNPQEHRFLVEGVYTIPIGRWSIEPRAGYEFVSNFNFQQDNDRHNIMAGATATYDFDLKGFPVKKRTR